MTNESYPDDRAHAVTREAKEITLCNKRVGHGILGPKALSSPRNPRVLRRGECSEVERILNVALRLAEGRHKRPVIHLSSLVAR
jgi:hypothetical protein